MVTVTLLVSCRDRTGIVAALSNFVFRHGGNIIDADQHSEAESERFFMRLVWSLEGFDLDGEGIRQALTDLAATGFEDMRWDMFFSEPHPRVAVFCSQAPHCLYDLLLRQKLEELSGEIALVVSNHEDLREVTEYFGLPFRHIPLSKATKKEAEEQQQKLLREHEIDLVVLARYMQILSAEFVASWPGRIINIHHSFLPAFAGAKPYHQAKARGVKIIGATAHYVTAALDQGPIIAQDVARVSHRDEVGDMIRKGRDLERQVLARAVRLHLERRVLIESNRTIVFG